jgi:hypothetical protein
VKVHDIREKAFAMPLTAPAYPPGPYRFIDREYLVITYRTDADKLRSLVPEPLQIDEPLGRAVPDAARPGPGRRTAHPGHRLGPAYPCRPHTRSWQGNP